MKFGQVIQQNLFGKLMIINKRVYLEYSLLILFISASGVPYISDPKINVLLLLVMSSIFYIRKMYLNKSFLLFTTILLLITLLQALKFDFVSVVTSIGLFTMVFNGYFIVKILDKNFISYYINILYYMALISFVFFFPILFLPSLGSFLVHSIVPLFSIFNIAHSVHETVLIYTLSHIDIFRNSGPFWEPGAFAGYLLIAFMFNFVKDTNIKSKKNIVFLIAIVTTFSTTTYLALFIFLFLFYYKQIKNVLFKTVIVVGLLSIAFFAYTSLDFLGKKIEHQIEEETSKDVLSGKNTSNTGRFITIIRDMKDLDGHEWIGRGAHSTTRFEPSASGKIMLRSVGLTDIIVKYGIPFFIIIVYFLYKSICAYIYIVNDMKKSHLVCVAIVLSMLILIMSETYFNYSLYWSLSFLIYGYNKRKGINY